MKIIKSAPLLILLVSVYFLLISCKHETPGLINNGLPSQTGNCSADSVYFVNTIQPLIISNCATTGYHDAITHKAGIALTSYTIIRSYATPYNGAGSKLYKVLNQGDDERMPPAAPLAATHMASILKWINQGALFNQCAGGCDATQFTYSGAVASIISTNCSGCHNPASLGGGIDLATYAAVNQQALHGRMMGSILHSPGYSAMPKGGNKLSDCEISQLQQWIQAGAPNN